MTSARHILAALVMLGGLSACGDDPREATTLTVFAASSLTDTFEEIGMRFEAQNDATVTFSFGGSSDLVTQVQAGAPADVFAAADEATMNRATDDELTAADPEVFATNTLTIAVPTGNLQGIDGLDDLTDETLDVVLCAPEVPCGAAATKVEDAAGVDIRPASEEQNVTDVLNKVATGEADAGLVYVTDVGRAAGVAAVDFPESASAVNSYPIAVVKGSDQVELAEEFVDFVLSRAGQETLDEAGFGSP